MLIPLLLCAPSGCALAASMSLGEPPRPFCVRATIDRPASHLSGWRDLNPRPLAPKASALPSCATPRGEVSVRVAERAARGGAHEVAQPDHTGKIKVVAYPRNSTTSRTPALGPTRYS